MPKKNFRLTTAALLTAAPMLLLGGGAAFAETTDAPVDLIEIESEGSPNIQAPTQDENDVSASETEGNPEELESTETGENGGENGENQALLGAPEFDTIVQSAPRQVLVTNIAVPGIDWPELDACGINISWAGQGFAAGPFASPGPHAIDVPEHATEFTVGVWCIALSGSVTPVSTQVVSLAPEGGSSSNGENGAGSASGSIDAGVAPVTNAHADQLAATGGPSSVMLGVSAALAAALGAGLLLARRFTKAGRTK